MFGWLPPFYLFIQSGAKVNGLGLLMFRVSLLCPVRPLCEGLSGKPRVTLLGCFKSSPVEKKINHHNSYPARLSVSSLDSTAHTLSQLQLLFLLRILLQLMSYSGDAPLTSSLRERWPFRSSLILLPQARNMACA